MLFKNLTAGSARTMAILGVIFTSIAAGHIGIWLGLDSSSRSTAFPYLISMVPTFAILGTVFMWVSGGPRRYQRFVERGVRGRATIKNLTMTGTRINEIPVLRLDLDVTIPGRSPYTAHDKVVAYPGTVPNTGTYECVVDPKKPEVVKVLLENPVLPEGVVVDGSQGAQIPPQLASAISGAVGNLPGNLMGAVSGGEMQRASAADLLRTGKPGRAAIVQTFPTGMRLEDGDQLLGFVLDVVPDDGGTSFRAMMAHRVPDSAAGRAVNGTTVPIAYDPADPARRVAIDWSRG